MEDLYKVLDESLTRLTRVDKNIMMAQAVLYEATGQIRIVMNQLCIQKLRIQGVCVGGDEKWKSSSSSTTETTESS